VTAPAVLSPKRAIGRYAIYDEIGAGGMAVVHFGRLLAEVGFSRTIAVKTVRPGLGGDPAFLAMLIDEARLASRVQHSNVVSTIDVVVDQGELFVVMEYVHGASLAQLIRVASSRGEAMPPRVASSVLSGVLQGLHAAHEARSTRGEPLEIVHRDVSPDNILVAANGVAKVADFGVAKARGRAQTTRVGELKGKLAYMAPEQFDGVATRQTDIFAASVVLWEALTGRRLFAADTEPETLEKLLLGPIPSPRDHAPDLPAELERVVLRGLSRDPSDRFPTALSMARALEHALPPASPTEVAQWVSDHAHDALARRAAQVERMENTKRYADEGTSVEGASTAGVDTGRLGAGGCVKATGEATRPVAGLALVTPPRRRRLAVTAGVGIVAALVSVAVTLGLSTSTPATSAEPVVAPAAPAAPAEKLTAEPPFVIQAADSASAAELTPTEEARAKAQPRSTHGATRATRRGRTKVSSPNACSPPYVLGRDGLRHYKPECF
jgi:eukaryotic-like serine/threonine-protein kinase